MILIYKIVHLVRLSFSKLLLTMSLLKFKKMLMSNQVFQGFPIINVGSFKEDSIEFFNHYDSYCYWLAEKLDRLGNNKCILDVGNRKISNAINSIHNEVTAIVLSDCGDKLSKVKYIKHDIANKLPFADRYFDIFTSLCSLNLVGLGRYGDKMSVTTLTNFILELNRVMKKNSDTIISLTYGHNCLNYRNTFVYDMPTIKRLFSGWELVDYLIDNNSGNVAMNGSLSRYSKSPDLANYKLGKYRIIYLHFKRSE